MKGFYIAIICSFLFNKGLAMKYCKSSEDCSSLGSLECVKTRCDWGMCACPRGKIARYLGSEQLYKCVDQKKVGESCSSGGDDGVCGAEDSVCINGTCECRPGYFSRFGGEICEQYTAVYPNEMVSGEATNCQGVSETYHTRVVAQGGPVTCLCPQGSQTGLPNKYGAKFQGKKVPQCMPILVDDVCVDDSDCRAIQGSQTACIENKCVCNETGHVSDITKAKCGKPLKFGDICPPLSDTICPGADGLFCGKDVCDFNSKELVNRCVCHYTHTSEGETCQPRKVRSSCYGDENCKGINMNAICVSGQCQSDGEKQTLCTGLLLMILITNIL